MSEWRPIETAPRDGTIIDVWLDGDLDVGDVLFCCDIGSRRSISWSFRDGKFRPHLPGLAGSIAIFIQPTHWMPRPGAPNS